MITSLPCEFIKRYYCGVCESKVSSFHQPVKSLRFLGSRSTKTQRGAVFIDLSKASLVLCLKKKIKQNVNIPVRWRISFDFTNERESFYLLKQMVHTYVQYIKCYILMKFGSTMSRIWKSSNGKSVQIIPRNKTHHHFTPSRIFPKEKDMKWM